MAPLPPPLRWHYPAKDNEATTACGLPMPVQVVGSQLPMCFPCMQNRLAPLYAEPPRQSAREIYGNPKLRLEKSG